MVFSSHIFIFYFLPIALIFYFASPRFLKPLTLSVLSYIFYAWVQPWYVFLMFGSTLLDYYCGLRISNSSRGGTRRGFLWLSIIANLSLLGFFKYTLFLANNTNFLLDYFGFAALNLPDFVTNLILPVGISFYTFQSMSYSIDIYRGDAKAANNFIDFACYVSMFPQLVAGPIVRYQTVAEQIRSRKHSVELVFSGIARFQLGFAKKILLANPMGAIADPCFTAAFSSSLSSPMAWYGLLAYALQIYFDFSAYSDMAIGLGRVFGFKFLENFDSPYKSQSITEFWRRWHISLSTFLRDYLYIPLGGNRLGVGRTYFNLFIVMFLGGLWHGASWNFVCWGCIHGLALAIERYIGNHSSKKNIYSALPAVVRIILSFFIVNIAWVFFRAENFSVAAKYLSALFGFGAQSLTTDLLAPVLANRYNLSMFLLALPIALFAPNTQEFLSRLSLPKYLFIFVLFLLAAAMMLTQDYNPFLYFQF